MMIKSTAKAATEKRVLSEQHKKAMTAGLKEWRFHQKARSIMEMIRKIVSDPKKSKEIKEQIAQWRKEPCTEQRKKSLNALEFLIIDTENEIL